MGRRDPWSLGSGLSGRAAAVEPSPEGVGGSSASQMKELALRTYAVATGDFPISIGIDSKDLPACEVGVGDVWIVREGKAPEAMPVQIDADPANHSQSIEVPAPQDLQACDLVLSIQCWFGEDAAQNACYEIKVTSNTAYLATTKVAKPTIDPSLVVLIFQYQPNRDG